MDTTSFPYGVTKDKDAGIHVAVKVLLSTMYSAFFFFKILLLICFYRYYAEYELLIIIMRSVFVLRAVSLFLILLQFYIINLLFCFPNMVEF